MKPTSTGIIFQAIPRPNAAIVFQAIPVFLKAFSKDPVYR
jgi:hypothetical protein